MHKLKYYMVLSVHVFTLWSLSISRQFLSVLRAGNNIISDSYSTIAGRLRLSNGLLSWLT
jgi:hypothetical protein